MFRSLDRFNRKIRSVFQFKPLFDFPSILSLPCLQSIPGLPIILSDPGPLRRHSEPMLSRTCAVFETKVRMGSL